MEEAFKIVILGCCGGPRELNLSGYLLFSLKNQEAIALDAGTLLGGIEIAMQRGNLEGGSASSNNTISAAQFLKKHIKAYLISHAHLDHISGLVINSQIDDPKFILGTNSTIDLLRDHIFNGKIWPNYGSEGIDPLWRYQYIRLTETQKKVVPNTSGMHVEVFILNHPGNYLSSAFLIEENERYVLYFGDTSADSAEPVKRMTKIWKRVAPLIREKKLAAVFLECSFSHRDAELTKFGHLDSRLMLEEFHHLVEIAGSIKGLKVIVTHRKDHIIANPNCMQEIETELRDKNACGIEFIFPVQGDVIFV